MVLWCTQNVRQDGSCFTWHQPRSNQVALYISNHFDGHSETSYKRPQPLSQSPSHSSGAVWESKWPSWPSVLTSLLVSVDVKLHLTILTHRSQLAPNYVNRHPRTLSIIWRKKSESHVTFAQGVRTTAKNSAIWNRSTWIRSTWRVLPSCVDMFK